VIETIHPRILNEDVEAMDEGPSRGGPAFMSCAGGSDKSSYNRRLCSTSLKLGIRHRTLRR